MTGTDNLVARAEKIREREHMLKRSLRLRTREAAIEFIHSKSLVSALGGNELPSLISAILGRQWTASKKGFAGWTEWWSLTIDGDQLPHVIREIEGRSDILASRIFRRSKTLVSHTIWPILDPIVEHHKTLAARERAFSILELKLMETVESEGSIRTDRLRKKLKLHGNENNTKFHRSLVNLESHGLIVGFGDPHPESHLHANIWQTWADRTRNARKSPSFSYEEAIVELLKKTIETSILVREDQIKRLYAWTVDFEPVMNRLVDDGTILRAGGYLIPSKIVSEHKVVM
jgi:hypothetical protein